VCASSEHWSGATTRGDRFARRSDVFDVVIVGGGPAGLSAALVLGRCRRRVLVCDTGKPRNGAATAIHGYLTRDGTSPHEFLQLGRDDLGPYEIELRHVEVTDIQGAMGRFDVALTGGEHVATRTVLLATGVVDHMPDIEGIDACYGMSVFHCPYCDGWEVKDRPLAVIGQGAPAAGLSLSLKTWSDRVVICANGRSRLRGQQRQQLTAHDIAVYETPITRLDHDSGHMRSLVLVDGTTVRCEAAFFTTGQSPRCEIASRLGCELTRNGVVKTDHLGQTRVAGLYVAGDASRDVQFIVVAASEGAKAAVAINKALQAEAGLAPGVVA
jgi:thioredoxin reductase